MTNPRNGVESGRRDRPLNVSMILAEQVLDLFEQSGTTPKEQNTALDIVRTIVLDRVYGLSGELPRSAESPLR